MLLLLLLLLFRPEIDWLIKTPLRTQNWFERVRTPEYRLLKTIIINGVVGPIEWGGGGFLLGTVLFDDVGAWARQGS